jgi:N-methylhydantoinase A
VRRRFDEAYSQLYGRTYPESPVEFVNFRVRASLPVRLLELPRLPNKNGRIQDAIKGERKAFSDIARDFIPFAVYDRYKLFPGAKFSGPAIVEERESTVIVGEDAQVSVDEFGFLWIAMPGT